MKILWDSTSSLTCEPLKISIRVLDVRTPAEWQWTKYWHFGSTILGPYHRCGRREWYGYIFVPHITPRGWHGNYLAWQCAPCHRQRSAQRHQEWRAEQRAKFDRSRKLINVLRRVVAQLA